MASNKLFFFACLAILILAAHSDEEDDGSLLFDFYDESCPNAEAIINRKVKEWVQNDPTLGPSLLRLHFHDFAVRGCDGSILLDNNGGERSAETSKTLRGFEVIDDIKAELERQCPKTVSCADILTASSRDATVMMGGPFWAVPYGRKDGKVSVAEEAEALPVRGNETVTEMMEFYQSKGLTVVDLVVLSGAHTIGRAACGAIQDRLYNFNGGGAADPSLSPAYLNYLTRKCRWSSDMVNLDGITPEKFDSQYYTNLKNKMGLLATDQALASDPRTAPLVNTMASAPYVFPHQFAASMAKLGDVLDIESQNNGEIRINCNRVNSY